MRRRLAIAVALVALAAGAGCLGGGGGQLEESASYDWNTTANATYDVTGSEYHAIYRVERNQTVGIYQRDDLGGEQSVAVSALQFRYPNGSVLYANGTFVGPDGEQSTRDEIPVETSGERRIVTAPAEGQLAYTAPTPPKSFRTPVLVEGSHEVILPPNVRISAPLLGIASPGGYEHSIHDGRVHMWWDEAPSGEIDLRYYLQRDFYIYLGLVGALLALGAAGVVYYRLQIQRLEQQREEVGLDVDTGDTDSGDGGPP